MFRVPRRNIHPSSLAFVVSSRSPTIKALNFVFILFPESPVPPINKGDGDKLVFSSSPSSLLLYLNNFSNPNLASFVFPVGLIHFKSSTTTNLPSAAFADNATLNPSLLTFFCNLCSKSLGIGPCAVPPPRICGARRLPTRALPPPFCGLAFLVVPETSPLDFVFAVDVPLFRANCHRTTLCAISTRIGTSKCRPGRTIVIVPSLFSSSSSSSSSSARARPHTGTDWSRMSPWPTSTIDFGCTTRLLVASSSSPPPFVLLLGGGRIVAVSFVVSSTPFPRVVVAVPCHHRVAVAEKRLRPLRRRRR